jgi:hypothetical protein
MELRELACFDGLVSLDWAYDIEAPASGPLMQVVKLRNETSGARYRHSGKGRHGPNQSGATA